ncbi:MAG TPA: 4Fe-4S dicluster domain-containing protein [Xanthomonadaceae bacterium]|jgi:electron transport complex protein RnfC
MPAQPAPAVTEEPCIRCGDCANVCPAQLQPQRLLLRLRDGQLQAAEREGALDCIECGRCDLVCPSRIPLLQRYREARALIAEDAARRAAAMAARERHRARQARLGRDEEAREERRSGQAASATSADAVAAAIARAQARRAAKRGEPKA